MIIIAVKRVIDYNVKARLKSDGAGVDIADVTSAFAPAPASGGSAVLERAEGVVDSGKSSVVGREVTKSGRPEPTAAKVIVSDGRALGSAEKFTEVMTPLADKLNAALGASRAADDVGYAPIVSVADYGLEADLFTAVPELASAL